MFTLLEMLAGASLLVALILTLLTKGGFFKSMRNKAIAKAEAINDQYRDPEADGKVALIEARRELVDMKGQRSELLVQIKGLQEERQQSAFDVTKWERVAQAAGLAQKEDDVIKAVGHKQEAEEEVKLFDAEIQKCEQLAAQIKTKIDDREEEISNAERDTRRLAVTVKFAKFRETVANDLAGTSATATALSRLRSDARAAQNRAEVAEEEAGNDTASDALAKKYTGGGKRPVDAETVARYMQKSAPQPAAA